MRQVLENCFVTQGFLSLTGDVQAQAFIEFYDQRDINKDDWFYALLNKRVFACMNELSGFTFMLAEEY